MTQISDEALSELAECIDDACQDAISTGKRVAPVHNSYLEDGRDDPECNCPLGYMLGDSYPIGMRDELLSDFVAGYDAPRNDYCDSPGFTLGKFFRERYP